MTRPVCLITGATDGVGRVTAMELAKKGFHVILAARDATKAATVEREIAAVAGDDRVESIVADLSSLQQVRRLAATFRERHSKLDVLINNAGVFAAKRTLTEDGYETSFQVNYLSHFLLTRLLLGELRNSARGRVLNLSSSVCSIGRFDPNNLQSEKRFSVLGTYAATKLFMLMFTFELAERLRGTRVTANAVHPGIVRTNMMLRAPGAFRVVSYLSLPFSVSPERGAATSVHLACSPELSDVSGRYFARGRATRIENRFDTPANRRLLWESSARLVGEASAPPPQEGIRR